MKASSFHSLCETINTYLNQKDKTFFDIVNILDEYKLSDHISMLDSLIDEVTNNKKLPKVSEQHMYLIRKDNIGLLLRLLGQGESHHQLSASPYDAYLLNLSGETLEIPRYQCQIDKNDLSLRPPSLQAIQPLILAPQELYFSPSFDSILLLSTVKKNVPILIFQSKNLSSTTWQFDLNTLKPLQRVATELQTSRIQVALKVLSKFNDSNSIDAVEKICMSDQPDFVRWEAAQLLYKLSKSKGKQAVVEFSLDHRHKALQKAAQATMNKISGTPS